LQISTLETLAHLLTTAYGILHGYISPVIEEYPMMYAKYVENSNYVEEAFLVSFFALAMYYEEHIKQWLLKVEGISHLEVVQIF
jgi:hypothetical protein